MTVRYQKTDAGRDEIRARRVALPRPARTLLLIVDGTKSGEDWVSMVAGATAADLQRLVDAGMLSALPSAAAPPVAEEVPLVEALQAAGFSALYDYLMDAVQPRLGLMHGYRIVLEIERSGGAADLRQVALQFVELVREVQGDDAAREVSRELAALR